MVRNRALFASFLQIDLILQGLAQIKARGATATYTGCTKSCMHKYVCARVSGAARQP